MTTDPTDLPAEKVAALAEALGEHNFERGLCDECGALWYSDKRPVEAALRHATAALAPLVAGWLAEAEAKHCDLTSRLGFGDGITEPQADNDTIARWFEEQGRDAREWQESQLWRNDCYAKGHPDDEDCHECDPTLRLAEAEAAVERVRALADEWERTGREGLPHLGCLDMYRHCADELRATLAPSAPPDAQRGGER